MKYKGPWGQMDLSDRLAIETGIGSKDSFKRIAKLLGRHPSTISQEILQNRTFIKGSYFYNKDCQKARMCRIKHLCGETECDGYCVRCRSYDCRTMCDKYASMACHRFDKPPYVCNNCDKKKLCNKDKYIYTAKYADAAVVRRRSESRQGIRISNEQLKEMDELITRLVKKKGQPLTHIYAEHKNELPVSLRSLYNYIDNGELTVKNIDLRRKTGYRRRGRTKREEQPFQFNQEYRQCRTYEDFEYALKTKFSEVEVTEMDTVKGTRESGKRLLTMIFRKNNIMLLFLMPDGKAESVKRVFDYLEAGLGYETFTRLFPVFLTDNGSEFKRVDDLELNDEYLYRTNVYYCDPMASWQKGCIEKNHEYIRYVVPRGKTLNPYTQEDMTLLMNHINSTRRPMLGNKSPYELIEEDDSDMKALCALLKMHLIPPDEVHLMPDLFSKK